MTILPMMLMSGVMVMMFVGGGRGALTWVMAGLMGAAMLGMLVGQLAMSAGERKHRMGGDRRDYLRYLSQQRKRVRRSIEQQREATDWRHPDPSALWSVALTTRRWERRPSHPDLLDVHCAGLAHAASSRDRQEPPLAQATEPDDSLPRSLMWRPMTTVPVDAGRP